MINYNKKRPSKDKLLKVTEDSPLPIDTDQINTDLLKSNSLEEENLKTKIPSKFLQFSKDGAYDLYCYLKAEYTRDDNSLVTKFSNIYNFLAYHQYLFSRSKTKYMEFINDHEGLKMSKVFTESYSYKEEIFGLLGSLKKDFEYEQKMK